MTLDLRGYFSEFRGADPARIHLAAHSHHFWPDAACRGHRRALADAARLADRKWETVFGALLPRVQRGIAAVLALQGTDDPYGTEEQLRMLERIAICPVETRLIAGARHAPHLEARQPTLEAIVPFVRSVSMAMAA